MLVSTPREAFPEPGTTANPVVFYDSNDVLLCYEASGRAGSGNVVLKFAEVIDFKITPVNVEGLKDYRYRIQPWTINEVVDAVEAEAWKVLEPRLWLISFTDTTIEVLFDAVTLVTLDLAECHPRHTLMGVLR